MDQFKTIILLFFICISVSGIFSQSIPLNANVEVGEISWPGDDMLCDGYNGSEGPMSFRVYRIKNTKQIIHVVESGSFCQGDSEYGYEMLFNEKGEAVFSSEGGNMYLPTVVTIFKEGIPQTEVEYPADEDTETKILIRQPQTKNAVTTQSVEDQIKTYFHQMQVRADTLKKMKFQKDQWQWKKEADSIVTILEAEIKKGIQYQNGYTYRLPLEGESATLKGTDIRLRNSPSAQSKVIRKVNGYDWYIEVLEVKGSENIAPYGTYPWYKIKVNNPNNTPYEGWIFGAFVLPDVYLNTK